MIQEAGLTADDYAVCVSSEPLFVEKVGAIGFENMLLVVVLVLVLVLVVLVVVVVVVLSSFSAATCCFVFPFCCCLLRSLIPSFVRSLTSFGRCVGKTNFGLVYRLVCFQTARW